MRLGEALLKEGLISKADLDKALLEQTSSNERLGTILLKKGLVSDDDIFKILSYHFNITLLNLKALYRDIKPEILALVAEDIARKYTIIPMDLKNNSLVIATSDPLDIDALDLLRMKTGYRVECMLAKERDILEAIDYCYNNLPLLRQHIDDFIEEEEERQDIPEGMDHLAFAATDQPVVKYVRGLLIQAVGYRASDIHLSPKEHSVELRFRIDGVLHQIDAPPKSMFAAICTRIKILSELDIAERRMPQDGRFKVNIGKSEIDVRTSVFPTIYGENVVMRLLETSSPLGELSGLGFDQEELTRYKTLLEHSYGMILVTGPTGSGKTTTLYTSLNEIKSSEKNIITLEDPVEYRLPFIQQAQVNSGIGFNFARGLRSILRQDPDVIMVGEIRDQETAEIAIQAALTGHLVFSTLHTNDASGAPVRLVKMGIEPFLISSALLGVVAQRLVRKICPNCQESYAPDKDLLKKMGLDDKTIKFKRGRGCPECLNSGYRGRLGLYEILALNDHVRELIVDRRSSKDIRLAAKADGFRTLREAGLEKVKQGLTTPEEVLRVTQENEEI